MLPMFLIPFVSINTMDNAADARAFEQSQANNDGAD